MPAGMVNEDFFNDLREGVACELRLMEAGEAKAEEVARQIEEFSITFSSFASIGSTSFSRCYPEYSRYYSSFKPTRSLTVMAIYVTNHGTTVGDALYREPKGKETES